MNRVLLPGFAWWPKLGLFMLVIFTGWQCLDSPDFPDEPYIEFTQVSKDTMLQGNFQEDSVFVLFHFQDGDGDIGKSSQDAENNVFFIDERTGIVESTFGIPAIPQEGANNGVEGDVRILVFTTCCFYPPETGILPCEPNELIPLDTIQYRIYMKDNAGHKSNEILTTPIILRCN